MAARWHSKPVDPRAPHFRWREFFDWHVAAPPPLASRPAIHELATVTLEPLRRRFGAVQIHSAYRTSATNRAVGGAPHSHHLYDIWATSPAVDLSCRKGDVGDWAEWLEKLGIGGMGTYSTHLHVDRRRVRTRWTG